MKNAFLLFPMLVLGSCVILAQQPPPSDYGLGNTHLSSNSNVQNDQSFSPDINQAVTNTRGATTRPQSGSPYFAGSSVSAETALSNGAAGSSQTAVSTDERAAYAAGAVGAQSTSQRENTRSAAQNQGNAPAKPKARQSKARQETPQRVTSSIPLNQGVSTTSTPGPSTDVPRNPLKARQQMPGLQAVQINAKKANTASSPPR